MKLSKRAEYGLIAAVRLAQRARGGPGYLRSRQMAEEEELPAKFLEAILLQLKSAEIIESKVGAGGGYRLVRDPGDVPVVEIVKCLEPSGAVLSDEDTASPNGGGRVGVRAMAEVNRRVVEAYEAALGSMSLEDLLRACESDGEGVLGGADRFRGDDTDRRIDKAAL